MSILDRVHAEIGDVRKSELRKKHGEVKDRLRHELLDYLGVETVAQIVSKSDAKRAREELGVALDTVLAQDFFMPYQQSELNLIKKEVLDQIIGLGVLQPLMEDDSITEIMVNGCGSLYYERAGKLIKKEQVFDTKEQIMLVIDRILAPLGRRLDESCPLVNARLSNGDRVNAVNTPIAVDGPYITIRRFTGRIVSLERLLELGSLPPWYALLLKTAVKLRKDIAVAGGTGSGKTTLLNALSLEIPHSERIVTIEDSAELSFKTHPHVVRLEARGASIEGKGEVSIRDLVANALRMRPDRIVVGEVRGAEAIDMLQAMNTGHDGSLTTLHAGSATEAISRLVLMARFGMDLPAHLIEEQIATALDFVVMSKRFSGGKRAITSLSAVSRTEKGSVKLAKIVHFDEETWSWELRALPSFVEEAFRLGELSQNEYEMLRACVQQRKAA